MLRSAGFLLSFKKIYVLFRLCWVFVAARAFSSCFRWGLLFVSVLGILIVVAFLVAEHRV